MSRKAWTPKPTAAPAAFPLTGGIDYVGIYFRKFYEAHASGSEADNILLASAQSGLPSGVGIMRLPGDTSEAKAAYLIAYIEAGAALGCSAEDMIDERHDSGLNLARPLLRGVKVTDPAIAARAAFAAGGIGIDLIRRSFANEKAANPNWSFFKAAVYVRFWSQYGMPAA